MGDHFFSVETLYEYILFQYDSNMRTFFRKTREYFEIRRKVFIEENCMNRKWLPHFIAVGAFVVFIVLGLACASTSDAVKSAASIHEVTGLSNKLAWLRNNAESGGEYIIDVNSSERINGGLGLIREGSLSYKGKNNITITLRGAGSITNVIYGAVFLVGSGVTLILDGNITLIGYKPRNLTEAEVTNAAITVFSGGTFVMNNGTITGNVNNSKLGAANGGGVEVNANATFLMKGGTITGNICFPVTDRVTSNGGGVYVDSKGTFTKTGGTIYGYTGDSKGNEVRELMGNSVSNNKGHAVYAGNKCKETTAGPDVNLHYSNGTFSGAWDN
jgi:hypothetical protein